MLNIEFNSIAFDVSGVMSAIQPYVLRVLNASEDRLIELMQMAIDETSSAPHDWRNELKSELRHIETLIQHDVITYCTGVQYNPGGADWLRAMVIAYGMGTKGLLNYTIYAGPEGRMVWNEDLTEKVPSRVKTEHPLPETWNHEGGRFVDNAIRNLQVEYEEICERVIASIPASVFYANLQITPRR